MLPEFLQKAFNKHREQDEFSFIDNSVFIDLLLTILFLGSFICIVMILKLLFL